MWWVLPEELWSRIMEIGTENKSLEPSASSPPPAAASGYSPTTILFGRFLFFIPIFGNDLDLSDISNCRSYQHQGTCVL
ncbi:hypothetical protein BUALT_Bualt12G0053400 [Buddleja alternifolia]|uniref:Uncharacterized protein n=1 Tax=Buddleja alternifolia TaxID=168488 RepID=A0AAV6WZF9_9LAMI|nr:hypothetical protein BUALT_Bualt12G0053400 [Buddleja alternifolia]